MKMNTVQDLLIHELQDIRSFEQQLTEALTTMSQAASDERLKSALTAHQKQTMHQRERVEALLAELKTTPGGVKCQGMAGVLREGTEMMGMEGSGVVKDLGLIGAAQRVEHYEMAAYSEARRLAESLGLDKMAGVLEEILEEEMTADELLTSIADEIDTAATEAGGVKRSGR